MYSSSIKILRITPLEIILTKTLIMKKLILPILTLSLIFISFNFGFSQAFQKEHTCVVYFTGVGCTHCAKADPFVLEDLLREYPNFIVIEYEVYQQSENAPLLYEYDSKYQSGLGIPLMIFNKEQHIAGDLSILRDVRGIIEKSGFNKCPLIDGSSIDFDDLNLTILPGFPKIWYQEKILIKAGSGGNSQLLKSLLTEDNLSEALKGVEFERINPLKVPISGRYIEFDNAISIGNWIFQWNGEELETPVVPLSEEEPPEEELPLAETKLKLTLSKIVSLAVVDAVNPCALAVLTLMLVTILTYNPTQKRDVLWTGLAFVTSVFIMYFIYGLVIIKSFQVIQALTLVRLWLYKILGFGAIILGCFKIKDFFQAKGVCKVSPRVDRVISKVTSPRGAFWVGAFVTVFLLPCTIGPYIICGGILSSLEILKSSPWLLLYNLIFVLPMIVVVLIIYFGMRKIEDISGWQAKNMKYLDLASGLIILGLGIGMILGLV